MNRNEIVKFVVGVALVVALSMVIQIVLSTLFGRKTAQETHEFVAPTAPLEAKPLNTRVDFVDMRRPAEARTDELETDGARLVFTTDGASLDRLEFKRLVGKNSFSIDTIFPLPETERDNRCFLVAFRDETPYYYSLVERRDSADLVTLTYAAEIPTGTVKKTFTVYKHTYQIDLDIDVVPLSEVEAFDELRVFVPSPIMPSLGESDVISSIVAIEHEKAKRTARSRLDVKRGWLSPSLFGIDSQYFVHAMVRDENSFCQRAYYKFCCDKTHLTAIMEGPQHIKGPAHWKLSFYCGPKESISFAKVDVRLDQTLDYSGLLGPIAKWLLFLLNLIYGYVNNYGWAIIILTLLIKLALLPLTIKTEAAQKKHLEYRKKFEYIRQRYKDDPERLKQEQAELVAKHGLPGLSGCLPLLLQLPIFSALNRLLAGSIDLYRAPFLWIPDLAAKDPWYILPILTTLCSLAMMQGVDARQRLSGVAVACVFGAFATTFSSGVALFIFSSVFLGVVQTVVQRRFF